MKYITVKLTEDQARVAMYALEESLSSDGLGEHQKAFRQRTQQTLVKAINKANGIDNETKS